MDGVNGADFMDRTMEMYIVRKESGMAELSAVDCPIQNTVVVRT